MPNSGELLSGFYEAVARKDLTAAREFLDKDLVFVGLFETYPNAESYLRALSGLLGITKRLTVKKIVGEGDYAAVFFELVTSEPAAATTLVAELHEFKNGKIVRAQSAFDGRPFAAMFGAA
jgi:hypothetical protein